MPKPSSPEDWMLAQAYVRARDDATEIANLTSALEVTIDPDNSAIVSMMDKYKKIVDKNKLMSLETGFENKESRADQKSQSDA